MLQTKVLLLAVVMVPLGLVAQNLIQDEGAGGSLGNWDSDQVQVTTETPHSGENCFKTLKPVAQNSTIIEVDPDKSYELSGWVKSADDRQAKVKLALIPLDANKVPITSAEILAVPDTETELAEECKAQDTIVKVVDASNWTLNSEIDVIAFHAVDGYGDLPNRNISPLVKKVEKKGNVWELTLEQQCGTAYPAGTKIRKHQMGSTYMYPASIDRFQSNDWVELTGKIKGLSESGTTYGKFWAGTKYVQPAVVSLEGNVYFDDIKLEEK